VADDREIQVARPAGQRKALYRQALAQCGLAVLARSAARTWPAPTRPPSWKACAASFRPGPRSRKTPIPDIES
jgi:hypothetical protein